MDGITDATFRRGIGAARQPVPGHRSESNAMPDANHADGIRNGIHPIRIRDGKETAIIRKA
jgi:hypothetical protein